MDANDADLLLDKVIPVIRDEIPKKTGYIVLLVTEDGHLGFGSNMSNKSVLDVLAVVAQREGGQ